MTRQIVYADITHDEAARAALEPVAPIVAEMELRGLTPLCAIRSTTLAGTTTEWAVLVDEGRTVAASVAMFGGRPNVYVATRRDDGSVIETQWLSWRTFMTIGPSAFLSDRPAKRFNAVDLRRTVATTLALHARRRARKHAREVEWTADGYLAFRAESGLLVEMNNATRKFFTLFFVGSGMGAIIVRLAFMHVRPLAIALAVAAYFVAMPLFVFRACTWAAGLVLKCTPMRTRRAIRGEGDSDD